MKQEAPLFRAERKSPCPRTPYTQPLIRLYVETAGGDVNELFERFEKLIKRAER
ncbi:hypothetical protein [Candidatus Methanocrinis natronophilus]|uniref:Uncharacterized protein n=1 Tax=Candidatus Methanocrinis natronophilus TaxID=3033396 RepID=A0ABT5XAT8_9EURY|nr:hypothetical protein [Candidatus Methanocrinis natronophilus]MDF0591840.1 hypothetical protein [Candidatus Methanocrinis natronophilus]